MKAQDERLCISYKHCDTITSGSDCRQNADNVSIGSSTFSFVLAYILSVNIIMSN